MTAGALGDIHSSTAERAGIRQQQGSTAGRSAPTERTVHIWMMIIAIAAPVVVVQRDVGTQFVWEAEPRSEFWTMHDAA